MAAPSFDTNIDTIIHELQIRVDLHKLQQKFPKKYPFLLASSASDSHLSRYDILFALPGEQLVLEKLHELSGPYSGKDNSFLDSLDSWWKSERTIETDIHLPFIGGWFLFLGYELAAEIEPTLQITPDSILPTAFAVRCPAAIIHDHKHDNFYVICENKNNKKLKEILSDAANTCKDDEDNGAFVKKITTKAITSEERPETFLYAVQRAKDYIAAGDIFQARGVTCANS